MLGNAYVAGDVVSVKELNSWWKLESKYDDFGKPIAE